MRPSAWPGICSRWLPPIRRRRGCPRPAFQSWVFQAPSGGRFGASARPPPNCRGAKLPWPNLICVRSFSGCALCQRFTFPLQRACHFENIAIPIPLSSFTVIFLLFYILLQGSACGALARLHFAIHLRTARIRFSSMVERPLGDNRAVPYGRERLYLLP